MDQVKKVLICPLDWGLGHATRCIPVINQLRKRKIEVMIASSGSALSLLRQEYPSFTFFELPSYAPVYQARGFLSLTLMKQLPKFRRVIISEHEELEKIVSGNSIDVVISDNRYGCWSSRAKSVFITHQSSLLMPKGFAWVSILINSFLQTFIKKFNFIWIPDKEGKLSFAFSAKLPNQRYIGWLSRFRKSDILPKKYDIIGLVSGPEPQRSLFAEILRAQLSSSGKKSLLVSGEPGTSYHDISGNLQIVSHLASDKLMEAIQSSEVIICRSGYSTIMDLIALGRNAIFVPTPQQPEQEFLASHLKSEGIAFAVDQNNFDLTESLMEVQKYPARSVFSYDETNLEIAVEELLR